MPIGWNLKRKYHTKNTNYITILKNKSIIHAIMKIQYTAYRDSKENKIIKYCQYYIFSIVLGHNSSI